MILVVKNQSILSIGCVDEIFSWLVAISLCLQTQGYRGKKKEKLIVCHQGITVTSQTLHHEYKLYP